MERPRRGPGRFGDFWQDNPEFSVFLVVIVALASWALYSYADNSPNTRRTSETVADSLPNPTAVVTTTRVVNRNGKLVTETVHGFLTVTNGETLLLHSTAFATIPRTSTRTRTDTRTSTVTTQVPGPTTTETVSVPGPTSTETVTVPGPTETVTVTVTETPASPLGGG